MNKILNWTFGACFRTLGRFLAIFIVFVLLLFVGSKLDIELPSFLAIRVNAASINESYELYSDIDKTNRLPYNSVYGNRYIDITINNDSLGNQDFYVYPNSNQNDFEKSQFDTINITTKFTPGTFEEFTNEYNSSYLVYSSKYRISLLVTWYLNNSTTTTSSTNCYSLNDYEYSTFVVNQCSIPYNATGIKNLKISVQRFDFTTNLQAGSYLGFDNNFTYIIDSSNTLNNTQQETNDKLDDVNQSLQDTNNTLNNDDTTGAQDSAGGFFENFSTETFGLTSIITSPLNAINSLISNSCSSLVLPLPFVDSNISLPCMSTIYSQYFGGFFSLYQIITTGLISYYIIVRIFNLVKDFKNPEHDEIEVVDL